MNNIPAFPLEMIYTQENEKFNGMTLRDYFASKAMPICYQYWMNDFYHPDYEDAEDRNSEGRGEFDCHIKDLIAEDAYLLADSMLKAREV